MTNPTGHTVNKIDADGAYSAECEAREGGDLRARIAELEALLLEHVGKPDGYWYYIGEDEAPYEWTLWYGSNRVTFSGEIPGTTVSFASEDEAIADVQRVIFKLVTGKSP